MLETIWIFAIGLTPPLLSLWMMRRTAAQTRAKLRKAIVIAPVRQGRYTVLLPDRYYLEGVGYLIGDISCRFNARSGYLRCAVNPQGSCQGCSHYAPTKKCSR